MGSPERVLGSEARPEVEKQVLDGAELDPRLKEVSFEIQRHTMGAERTLVVPVPVNQGAPEWALECNGTFSLKPGESWEDALNSVKQTFKVRLDQRRI